MQWLPQILKVQQFETNSIENPIMNLIRFVRRIQALKTLFAAVSISDCDAERSSRSFRGSMACAGGVSATALA